MLGEAVEGLLYMSESDEPFEVVSWPGGGAMDFAMDEKKILKLTGQKPGTPVEAVRVEVFFRELIKEQDWHGPEEKAEVKKYRGLLDVIKRHLTEPKVFRIGEVEVEIVIVGRTREGAWAGVKTKAVET